MFSEKIPNVLIVEDQAPLEGLVEAVEEVMPRHYNGFSKQDYAIAECYNEANIALSSRIYDIVLLDHRMPYENQCELLRRDFSAFCDTLEDVGYYLIPQIKLRNPKAIVIGTSSLSRDELKRFSAPDFRLEKVSMNVIEDLDKIVREIKIRDEGR
jgi:CheY-like chemotaxis protein